MQSLFSSPGGPAIFAAQPALKPLVQALRLNPSAAADVRAFAPLAARLPVDFAAQAEAASAPADVAALGRTIATAYAAAAPAAVAEIDVRAAAALRAAAQDPARIATLRATAVNLKPFAIYGDAAKARVDAFAAQVVSVRTQEEAEDLARRLQASAPDKELARKSLTQQETEAELIVQFEPRGKLMVAEADRKDPTYRYWSGAKAVDALVRRGIVAP